MWTAVAMTAMLAHAPVQVGDLELTNIRPTHGIIGAPRKDGDPPRLVPGDVFCLTFDIEGLKVSPDGTVKYAVGMSWSDKAGKVLYKEEPQPWTPSPRWAAMRAAFVAAQSFPETPPGEYVLKAVVKDRATDKEAEFSRKFEIGPRSFAVVRLGLSHDVEGRFPLPVCVVGQRLQVNFWVTGFDRDPKGKQPNITFKMRVLEGGRAVLTKDAGGEVKTSPEDYKMIPLSTFLFLNRAGKFTVESEVNYGARQEEGDAVLRHRGAGAEVQTSRTQVTAGLLLCLGLVGRRNYMSQLQERIAQFRKMARDDPDNELGHYRPGPAARGGRAARRGGRVVPPDAAS